MDAVALESPTLPLIAQGSKRHPLRMTNARRARYFILAFATTCGAATLRSQDVRFEYTQKDLFAAGGTFVNAWADYDNDGDVDQFVGFDGPPNRLYRN